MLGPCPRAGAVGAASGTDHAEELGDQVASRKRHCLARRREEELGHQLHQQGRSVAAVRVLPVLVRKNSESW